MKGQILAGLLIVATVGLMATAAIVVPAMQVQDVKASKMIPPGPGPKVIPACLNEQAALHNPLCQ